MTRLAPGEQPPQLIIFSFDGAGWHDRWQEFSAAAEQVDARFTGFLTGIYLVTDEHRDAYTGPGHAPGRASVGFGGSPEDVTTLVEDLNGAYRAGHEIGTHYNGHFCADNPPGAGDWSSADWTSELDQFFAFWDGWRDINSMPDAPELEIPASEVKGGRTPCLEGDWGQIAPAWAAHGLTYDSSIPGSGMAWPTQQHGVWEFAMQSTVSPTLGNVTAMDYNFWYKFNQTQDQPERAGEIHDAVLETYRHMYQATSTGNRAPSTRGAATPSTRPPATSCSRPATTRARSAPPTLTSSRGWSFRTPPSSPSSSPGHRCTERRWMPADCRTCSPGGAIVGATQSSEEVRAP